MSLGEAFEDDPAEAPVVAATPGAAAVDGGCGGNECAQDSGTEGDGVASVLKPAGGGSISCRQCSKDFIFTEGEKAFYGEKVPRALTAPAHSDAHMALPFIS